MANHDLAVLEEFEATLTDAIWWNWAMALILVALVLFVWFITRKSVVGNSKGREALKKHLKDYWVVLLCTAIYCGICTYRNVRIMQAIESQDYVCVHAEYDRRDLHRAYIWTDNDERNLLIPGNLKEFRFKNKDFPYKDFSYQKLIGEVWYGPKANTILKFTPDS